jgi:hypothetical protein
MDADAELLLLLLLLLLLSILLLLLLLLLSLLVGFEDIDAEAEEGGLDDVLQYSIVTQAPAKAWPGLARDWNGSRETDGE